MRRNWQKYMIDETGREPFNWELLFDDVMLAVLPLAAWRLFCWAATGMSLGVMMTNPFWAPPMYAWAIFGVGLLLTHTDSLGWIGLLMAVVGGAAIDVMGAIAEFAVKAVRVVAAILILPLIPITLMLPGFIGGVIFKKLLD